MIANKQWKRLAGVEAAIRGFCVANPESCGNPELKAMLRAKFGLEVTQGQVAGAVGRWGIKRTLRRSPMAVISQLPREPMKGRGEVPEAPKIDPEITAAHDRKMAVPFAMMTRPKAPPVDFDHRRIADRPTDTIPSLKRAPSPFDNLAPRPVKPEAASRPFAPLKVCAWPDPKCEADAHPGRPYCEAHCRVAYVGFNPHRIVG